MEINTQYYVKLLQLGEKNGLRFILFLYHSICLDKICECVYLILSLVKCYIVSFFSIWKTIDIISDRTFIGSTVSTHFVRLLGKCVRLFSTLKYLTGNNMEGELYIENTIMLLCHCAEVIFLSWITCDSANCSVFNSIHRVVKAVDANNNNAFKRATWNKARRSETTMCV